MAVPTQPLKGFRDFYPEDQIIKKYIFSKWREVCLSFGFEEYDGPILEAVEIYNKSGEDIGAAGKDLFAFEDRGGRRVALRPELTPTVGRMVAARETDFVKPIRWFSIGQFFRAEKPQRGRGREFFQLNADIFGSDDVLSDFEVIQLALSLMIEFGAKKEMFTLKINDRRLTDWYFTEKLGLTEASDKQKLMRLLDAAPKKGQDWLKEAVEEIFPQNEGLIEKLVTFQNLTFQELEELVNESPTPLTLLSLLNLLKMADLDQYCRFDPTIMRGFDYYTGMVFEVFDNFPENNRAMFGGGRYDDLLTIFGKGRLPAVGFAPGDITFRLFLESWNLLPKLPETITQVLVTVFPGNDEALPKSLETTSILRGQGIATEVYLSSTTPLNKQIQYANSKGIGTVVIIGPEELTANQVTVKNMKTGEQQTVQLTDIASFLGSSEELESC